MSVVPTLGPGGAESIAVDIAVGLASRGFESALHVIAEQRGERGQALAERLDAGAVVTYCANIKSPRFLYSTSRKLFNSITQFRPHAIIAHLPAAEFYVALASFRLPGLGKTRLRVLHNVRQPTRIQRLISSQFKMSIAVSNEVQEIAKAHGWAVEFIPNGVRSDVLPLPNRQHMKKSVKIAMVGSFRFGLTGPKGLDLALDALSKLADRMPFEFHLLGLPRADVSMLNIVSSANLRGRIVDHGVVPCLVDKLHVVEPDLCLMPSRNEGLSVTLMEYSVLGLPVVLSDIRSFKELFEPEFDWTFFASGNPVALADAIERRLGSEHRVKGYSTRAAQKFDIEKMLDRYARLISDCRSVQLEREHRGSVRP